MRLAFALLANAACMFAAPLNAQVMPGPIPPPVGPPQPPQYPPIHLGCGVPIGNAVLCSGPINSGVNYQEVGDLAMTLDPTARVENGIRLGGTRLVIGPGGGRFEFAATGFAKIEMEEGSAVRNLAGTGIFAVSQRGVDIVARDITANGQWGIRAYSFGPVSVHSKGDISLATSIGYAGISAQSAFDNVSIVNDGRVDVAGYEAAGILAMAGTGSENAVGNVHVINNGIIGMSGDRSTGIVGLASVGGNVELINNGSISSSFYGMLASSSRDSALGLNAGTITTSGDQSHGIWSRSNNGSAMAINSGGGGIATTGDNAIGMLATHEVDYRYDSPLLLQALNFGTIATSGKQADGMAASTIIGAVVLANGGSIITRGERANGMSVYGASPDAAIWIANSGEIGTSGTEASGIFVAAGGQPVIIDSSGLIETSGARGHAILVRDTGVGSLGIAVSDVLASGFDADAVHAESVSGEINILARGMVDAAAGYGISADSGDGRVATEIASGANVTGSLAALRIAAGGGARVSINGTLGGRGQKSILVERGSVDIEIANTGEMHGSFSLSGGDDRIHNSGMLALDDRSSFGAGIDRLENFGILAAASHYVSIAGLERFENAGLVTLVNGRADGVVDLGSAAWHGAAGSRIALDIAGSSGALVADKLRLGGATGTTVISLSRASLSIPLGRRVQLIEASGPIAKDAFKLDPNSIGPGFVAYRLATDASGVSVSAVPGEAVHHAAYAASTITQSWREGVDSWLSDQRTAGLAGALNSEGGRLWMRATADAAAGAARMGSISGARFHGGAGMSSRYRGLQAGSEHKSGDLRIGTTGGYLRGSTDLRGTADGFETSAVNVGAYAAWRGKRGWFANALAKVDQVEIDLRLATAGTAERTSGRVYGAVLEGGVRTQVGGFGFEPQARLLWSSTSIRPVKNSEAELEFADSHSAVAEAGIRLDSPRIALGSVKLASSFSLFVEHEMLDSPRLDLVIAGDRASVGEPRPGTQGRAEFSIRGDVAPGIGTYIQGGARFGTTLSGMISGGLQIIF